MLSIALASGVVLYYCFADHLGPKGIPQGALLRSPWATFPVAFGVNVYLFEGVLYLACVVLCVVPRVCCVSVVLKQFEEISSRYKASG